MCNRTMFRRCIDTIERELDHPNNPEAFLKACDDLGIKKDWPEVICARNQLNGLREAAEKERQRQEMAAEAARVVQAENEARRARIARDRKEIEQKLDIFNRCLQERQLDEAIELAKFFSEARIQAALTQRVGGIEERENFFNSLLEKIENVAEKIDEENQARAEEKAEQEALRDRAKVACGMTNGTATKSSTQSPMRRGKTAKDRAFGAWERGRKNLAARRVSAASGNSQTNGKKKGKK